MGKKVEKAMRGGATSANSRVGDDSSTPEPYTCTGNFPDDFAELWQRAGLNKDHTPVIRPRGKRPGTPVPDDTKTTADDEEGEKVEEEAPPTTYTTIDNITFFRPSIQVDFDVEETKQAQINHAKEIFIRSWKLEEKVIGILKLCILDRLQCINLWNVGINDHSLRSLASFLPSLPNIKNLVLDGNPIPETEPYYLLIGEDSPLHHLSLRNNNITDKGAEMLGKQIGITNIQNRLLTTLNLSFNHIGDKGAFHLSQGLRMNRILLSLSLSFNQISDEGCIHFSKVMQRFPLTHEEVVKRRRLLSQQGRGSSALGSRRADSKDRPSSNRSGSQMAKPSRGSSKKKPDGKKGEGPEKTPKKEERGKKDLTKLSSRLSMTSETPKGGKGKKSGGTAGKDGGKRANLTSASLEVDGGDFHEFVHPLLDQHAQHTDGKVFIPGCMTLINLNLSKNKIGKVGMDSMLACVQYQSNRHRMLTATSTAPGLLRLHLQNNAVSPEHPSCIQIRDVMQPRDPLYKPKSKTPEEDMQSVAG